MSVTEVQLVGNANTGASFVGVVTATSFSGSGANLTGVTPAGITATGGVISDYLSGGNVYRAHIFTSTGTFTVSAATGTGLVEYLIVAGGGGSSGIAIIRYPT